MKNLNPRRFPMAISLLSEISASPKKQRQKRPQDLCPRDLFYVSPGEGKKERKKKVNENTFLKTSTDRLKKMFCFHCSFPRKKNSHKHQDIKKASNQIWASSVSFWHFLSDKHPQLCHRALEFFQILMRNFKDSTKVYFFFFAHFLTHTTSFLPSSIKWFQVKLLS